MENKDEKIVKLIEQGQSVLGIEFGSTRVKSVLIDSSSNPIASGAFDWENSFENGFYTYSLDNIHKALQESFKSLKKDVKEKYGVSLTKTKAIGISAMMHGYLAFDKNDKLLVPFRTWRNTTTEEASNFLSKIFNYPIPQRWSISHLYQAILNKEPHVNDISWFTTLAGYVHFLLTGEKVLGIGDASGMFPINTKMKNYNEIMIDQFNVLVKDAGYNFNLKDLLPKVLLAGKEAGNLTKQGSLLLDPTGDFECDVPLCPPEGDAGTGMVATNSITPFTGNVSAGTSVFAMVVLQDELSKTYNGKIDLVTTPCGDLTAMAHANNCTGEYDKWINLFGSAIKAFGFSVEKPKLYDTLLGLALEAEKDCGGLIPYNYLSGESMTDLVDGRALFVRTKENNFTLSNFIRAQLYTSLGALRTGMDILFEQEKVKVERLTGHGGFFKTKKVGLTMMSSALHTKISALETAGEGGAWGMAILASFMVNSKSSNLERFLNDQVFVDSAQETVMASKEDIEGFNKFFEQYTKGLAVEKAAIENID